MPTVARVDPSKLALQRFYAWERNAPNQVTFTQPMGGDAGVRDFTFGEVANQTRRMANYLKLIGVKPGDRVAILSKNCAWWLMADLAIWMAGGVSVPLYPTLTAQTIRQILEHSESRVCFIGKLDGWEGMQPGVPQGVTCISFPVSPPNDFATWDDIIARTEPLQGEPVRDGGELSTIMYTSGTTGAPKGVMHSFDTFAWSIGAGLKRITMGANERMLSYLPLSHVAERALVEHGWLVTGMHVYFAESLDTFAQDLQRARPTVFFSVPRLWVKFQQGVNAKMPPHKLDRLLGIPIIRGIVRRKILKALGLDQCRFAAGGAAPMPPDLLRWYSRLGLDIIEVYGMTENCGVSHATLPGVNRPGTVGTPYDGVESRIDPVSGEIQMRSPGVMLGYYREPEMTRETFTGDGWLRTGDKGQVDEAGWLRITGRVKDLFKTSKGKYVAPAPIEDRLVVHPAVEACAVTGAGLGQPIGIVMLSQQAADESASAAVRAEMSASLKAHLEGINAQLDPHEQLARLVVVTTAWSVDNGFITPTFKVKRNRVEEVYAPYFERWQSLRETVVWFDEKTASA